MAFQANKKEQGSASVTGLAALFALGFTSFYVMQNQQKVNDSLMHARVKASSDAASLTNMNAVAQFKALLNNGKVGAEYLPALYPQNYWLADWRQITKNPSIPTDDVALGADEIRMSLVDSGDASGKPLESIFNGTQSQTSLKPQDGFIRILQANYKRSVDFDYVESVDVEVRTTKVEKGQTSSVSTRARIPVPIPQPSDPILQVSPAGANTWTTDFSNIAVGEYDLRVIASGVVYKAVIFINGDPVELHVFNKNTGEPTNHAATNVLAKDVVIGTVRYEFISLKVDKDDCSMEPTDGQFTVRTVLYNAKGEVSEAPQHETSTTFTVAKVAEAGKSLTDQEFKDACNDQCPYYEENEYKEPRLADLQDGIATDFSRPHEMWMRTTQLKVKNVKICENMSPMLSTIVRDTGRPPVLWDELDALGWESLDYVYYTVPSCHRKFLFVRGKCGCFADETLITLGDGKTQKRITELTARDLVWNPLTRRAMAIARMTSGPENVPMFDFQIEGKTVRITGTHPFPTDQGPKAAYELQEGDRVRTESGALGVIQKIALVPAGDKAPVVWNLELEAGDDPREHYVLANGVVTGDLFIQTRLQKKVTGTDRWVSKK